MPRKQRPPFEAAVTASPLFKLASEIRIMIYELLLIQEGGIFVPSDIFARRDYKRTDSTPHECNFCGLVFLSEHGCVHHIEEHHNSKVWPSDHHTLKVLLPEVSVSLLQTCRIIRLEASPILYVKNHFHFSDPTTASNFRWGTDCAQAGAVQELGIKFGSPRANSVINWGQYLTKWSLSLGQDFPRLKRMTIDLDGFVGYESATKLRSMSEGLRLEIQALDWVLVLMLNSDKVLDFLAPLVDRKEDSGDAQKEVRRHIWPSGIPTWRNALLWWGYPGEAVPQKYRSIGNQPKPCPQTNEGSQGVPGSQ